MPSSSCGQSRQTLLQLIDSSLVSNIMHLPYQKHSKYLDNYVQTVELATKGPDAGNIWVHLPLKAMLRIKPTTFRARRAPFKHKIGRPTYNHRDHKTHSQNDKKNLHRFWGVIAAIYFVYLHLDYADPASRNAIMGAPGTASASAFADGIPVGPLCASAFGVGGGAGGSGPG